MATYRIFPSILPTGDDAIEQVWDEIDVAAAQTALDAGDCPFCKYDGGYPTNHAPKAHPNRWEAFKRKRTSYQTSADSALTDGGDTQ